jgi:putative glutamine amidotransferase
VTTPNGSPSRRPVIGVTTYLEPARWSVWERAVALLPQSYVDGVAHAGATPVLLPPARPAVSTVPARPAELDVPARPAELDVPARPAASTSPARPAELNVPARPAYTDLHEETLHAAAGAIRAVDGLVLSGGADIDPARYGEPPHPRTATSPGRDAWELALLHAALAAGRPVLAICRGMQLLNVACGGTLHQHLPETVGHDGHCPQPGTFGRTEVRIAPAGRLTGILGARLTVSCHHHQAIHRLGTGLVPTGWATDGTIEAIEHPGHSFVLGVQWHPEEDTADRRLFAALVHAAHQPSAH